MADVEKYQPSEGVQLAMSFLTVSICVVCPIQFLIQLHFQASVGLHPHRLLVGPEPPVVHHLLKLNLHGQLKIMKKEPLFPMIRSQHSHVTSLAAAFWTSWRF